MCLVSTAALRADPQFKKTPFGTGAEVGFGLVKYHNTCVWFRVLFISSDFFEGLRTHRTPNGVQFRKKKDKATYLSFPDQLLVDLEAFPHKCTAEMTPLDYAAGLMENPSFKVAWKRGDKSRPVKLVSTEERHSRMSFGWSYLLTLSSAEVPLTDTLEIDVSLRKGTCLAHFTANLDSAKREMFPSTCK